MRKYFTVRIVSAIIFLVVLLGFSVINIFYLQKEIINEAKVYIEENLSVKELINNIETKINDKIFKKEFFIEAYGYIQKLMNKDEFSDFTIVKDDSGKMHYTYFSNGPNETEELVERTVKLSNELKNNGVNFVYLMTPEKYIEGVTEFPTGIPYAYHNETADNFLAELKKNGVDYIDFRENILASGVDSDKLFFNTDHHWTIETSFWAFTELINQLNEKYSLNLDEDNFYRDIKNYNSIIYLQCFLGAMGRKTGILYGGVDDFTLIYPKFNTSYKYYTYSETEEFELNGRFEESLILTDLFKEDIDLLNAESDKYFTYLFGNRPFVQVINNNNLDGLKVLFVKDSLIVPTAAFFSSICSQMDLIDPRYYDGDIVEYAKSQNYDFVFLSIYPQNLTESFFPFFEN